MKTAPKDPAPMQVALATLAPLIVGVFATRATMLVGERFGMDVVPFVLVGWCVLLFASAAWLNRVLFRGARTLLPFTAAIVAILLIWLWQRVAFISLVPRSGLTYGYFLRPDGAAARFWVLSCPFWVGLTCLSVCFVASLLSDWHAGARRSLACIIPWWLVAFLIFALPSMYLDAQGNASIFI
jgi:hypothetical protein